MGRVRCADGLMRRWAMVSMWSRTGTRRHNRHRNLRSISASVGRGGNNGLANAARPAAPVAAQNGSYGKISGNWPRANTQADPNMQACDVPTVCHACAHAVGFPILKLFRNFQSFYICISRNFIFAVWETHGSFLDQQLRQVVDMRGPRIGRLRLR